MRKTAAALTLTLAWLCVVRVLGNTPRLPAVSLANGKSVVKSDGQVEERVVVMDAAMEAVVDRLIQRNRRTPPKTSEVIALGLRGVNLDAAARRIERKAPSDVASLVRTSVDGKVQQPFGEGSLSKALKYLNMMIEKSKSELDDKLIECKVFEDMNRGKFEHIMTDLARLGEQIADLARLRSEAAEMTNVKEQEIMKMALQLKMETDSFLKMKMLNQQELTVRRQDLAVFQFMLGLVKCKKVASLAEIDPPQKRATVCEGADGLEINFGDAEVQHKLDRLMTPSAREAVSEVLNQVTQVQAQRAAGLLQSLANRTDAGDDDDSDTEEAAVALDSLSLERERREAAAENQPKRKKKKSPPKPAPPTELPTQFPPVKVAKRPDKNAGALKCSNGPMDCGMLHDKMSLMWGKYKDLVDELKFRMEKNEYEFQELSAGITAQLDALRNSKSRFSIDLSEAVASLNGADEEAAEMEEERRVVEAQYKAGMAACRKTIEQIVFQDICSYTKVRATVMKFSTVSPPDKIVDCDVSEWTPSECSLPCDNACGKKKTACGGEQTLKREVVSAANEFGHRCPQLSRVRSCNQVRCPVDCKLSKWSSFSKCTKQCGGGVQGRARTILTQPKNGGRPCNTVQETRPCNSGSCDRNCRLRRWSKWSPCSVACGGGFQERLRRVTIPIRGKGRCPRKKSKIRFGIRKCNTHPCVGDEICIAKQDLVIAVDGSGSISEKGFDVIKGFVSRLVDRYKGEYFGSTEMQIGVVHFGNGEIMDDGSIAMAKEVVPLTSNIAQVKKAVEGMAFLKGFTNMAQAFTVAEKQFLLLSRKMAQSAVLTITDGKPSFLFQTYEKVMQLKDKHIQLFFAPITTFKGEEVALMKKWASTPWETNLERIPGLEVLKADEDVFIQKVLVKFCPNAMSPAAVDQEETEMGYMLIRENGRCGPRKELLSAQKVQGAADCAALAEGAGYQAFSLGIRFARGKCYGEGLGVEKSLIDQVHKDRAHPPCPAGKWKDDALFDFYILLPVATLP